VRASTLFALSIALLVGLGAAVAVKVSGVLNPPAPPVAPPLPPPPPILVAARNLNVGDAVGVTDARVRPLAPTETYDYQKNRANYLPPVPEAAQFRFIRKNIEADQPLTQDMFEPIGKPEPLHTRLLPLTRAIDVQLERENSAAGLIQVGDWVDVYLTSEVGRTDEPAVSPRTALLARAVMVVAKRGTLYQTYAPLPPGPIQFTLAANPYRAALIDYARNKGVLSLMPLSLIEKKRLDALKIEVEQEPEKVVELALPAGSEEAKAELGRVLAYNLGQSVTGDEDLIRVFNLKPLTPPTPPQTVEYYRGVRKQGTDTFVTTGGQANRWAGGAHPAAYTFKQPKPPAVATKPAR